MLPEPHRSLAALDSVRAADIQPSSNLDSTDIQMGKKNKQNIREIRDQDISWIKDLMINQWGDETIEVHDNLYIPHELSGFIAISPSGEPVGLVTYLIDNEECEIVTLNSLEIDSGVGTALLLKVKNIAEDAGCKRICLTTTNDNLQALEYYHKRGFNLVAIYREAVNKVRKIKPTIPLVSPDGIPIQDEIELLLS